MSTRKRHYLHQSLPSITITNDLYTSIQLFYTRTTIKHGQDLTKQSNVRLNQIQKFKKMSAAAGTSGGQESFMASTSTGSTTDTTGQTNSNSNSNPGQKYEISSNEVPEPK